MADSRRLGLDEVAAHFGALENPRSVVNRKHPLALVVVIAGLGPDGDRAVADAGGRRQDAAPQPRPGERPGSLHSVTVWAGEYGLSLGQVACGEKSNEIAAISELLRLVDVATLARIIQTGTNEEASGGV